MITVYNFFRYLYLFIKYNLILKKVYRTEGIPEGLTKLFDTEFKLDWLGRMYAVINPFIVDGKYDPNHLIYELNSNGKLTQDEFVKETIMMKLNAARVFIQTNNLFDVLTYKIERLDDMGNHLFIIQSIVTDNFIKWTKLFAILLLILTIIVTILLIFL